MDNIIIRPFKWCSESYTANEMPYLSDNRIHTGYVYMHGELDTYKQTDLTECFYDLPANMTLTIPAVSTLRGNVIEDVHEYDFENDADFDNRFYKKIAAFDGRYDVTIQGVDKKCIGEFRMNDKEIIHLSSKVIEKITGISEKRRMSLRNEKYKFCRICGLIIFADDFDHLQTLENDIKQL